MEEQWTNDDDHGYIPQFGGGFRVNLTDEVTFVSSKELVSAYIKTKDGILVERNEDDSLSFLSGEVTLGERYKDALLRILRIKYDLDATIGEECDIDDESLSSYIIQGKCFRAYLKCGVENDRLIWINEDYS